MSQDGKKVDAFSLEAGVPKIEGEIQPKPKYADRISKRIIAVGLAVAVLMVGIFFASLEAMDHKKKGRQEAVETEKKKSQPTKVAEAVVPKELTDAPDSDGSKGRAAPASLVGSAPKAQDDLLGSGTGAPSLSGGAVLSSASAPAGMPSTVPSMGTAGGARASGRRRFACRYRGRWLGRCFSSGKQCTGRGRAANARGAGRATGETGQAEAALAGTSQWLEREELRGRRKEERSRGAAGGLAGQPAAAGRRNGAHFLRRAERTEGRL